MGKIQIDDDLGAAVTKLSDGNPGAMRACMELIQQTPLIDPKAGLGPFHYLAQLDDLTIYGPKIWLLYKDVCNSNIETVIGLLRGRQLGFIDKSVIQQAVAWEDGERWYGAVTSPLSKEGLKEVIDKVKAHLPDFGKKDAVA